MEQENNISKILIQHLQSGNSELNKQAQVLLETLIKQVTKQSPNITQEQIPTALFALIVNLLNKDQQDYQPFLLLLNMMMNRVSIVILKRFLLNIQNLIIKIKSKDQKYAKYSIVILTQTIQVMSKEEFMQNSEQNTEIVQSIIDSLWSENSLVRKESLKAIKQILEHKFFFKTQIATSLKQFFIENLESNDVTRYQFINQLIQQLVELLPIQILGDISYALIKALDTSNEELMIMIYLSVEQIMGARPLTVDIADSLMKQLLGNQPSFYKEDKVVQAYGQCLIQTLLHLNSLDKQSCKIYITSCIAVLQEILLVENENKTLPGFAQRTLQLLIENTIDSSLWTKKSQSEADNLLEDFLKIDIDMSSAQQTQHLHFQKIIVMIKHMMSSRYYSKIKYVFNVIGSLFQQIDSSQACLSLMDSFIDEFLTFMKEDKIQSSFKKCLGKLVGNIGSEYLLNKFPMTLKGKPLSETFEQDNNLWLLPYFQKNAKKQKLFTFINHFSPLIKLIVDGNINITNAGQEQMTNEQRLLKSIHYLLWECFPNFIHVDGNNEQELVHLQEFLSSLPGQLKQVNQHFDTVLKGLSGLLINLQSNQRVLQIVRNNAQSLISYLAKLVVPQKQQSKIILNVIGYLGQIAPKEYLDTAFKKNMQKIISDKNNNKLASNLANSLKNLDIINQIVPYVDLKDQNLDLSLKMVKLLIEEQSAVQKKIYRFIRILIHKVHSSYLPSVVEIMVNYESLMNYSRTIRIQLIQDLWEKMGMQNITAEQIQDLAEFVQQFLPEIIVGLRDSNKKCRKLAGDIFTQIGEKMDNLGMLKDFVSLSSAGLAGESALMKANSITAVSFLLEKFGPKIDNSYKKDLQSIILMLIKEENKEVFKAVLYFLKKYQKNIKKDQLETEVPQIFEKIFQVASSIRDKFLTQIKQIISRFVRKFGVEQVTLAMPEEHKNLPKSLVKKERREKKLKEKEKLQRNQEKKEQQKEKMNKKILEKMGLGVDDEDQMDEELGKDDLKEDNNLLLKFDTEKNDFHFVEKQFKNLKKNKDEDADIEDVLYKNGKLIVTDIEAFQRKLEADETGHKRKRTDKYTDFEKIIMEEKEQEKEKNAMPTRQIAKVKKNPKKQFVHNIQESGQTYRPNSNITGGDVQIKNKPDPYAYVQLNPKALNKRHRNKTIKSFEQVFNPTTSLKGIKTKKVKQE